MLDSRLEGRSARILGRQCKLRNQWGIEVYLTRAVDNSKEKESDLTDFIHCVVIQLALSDTRQWQPLPGKE